MLVSNIWPFLLPYHSQLYRAIAPLFLVSSLDCCSCICSSIISSSSSSEEGFLRDQMSTFLSPAQEINCTCRSNIFCFGYALSWLNQTFFGNHLKKGRPHYHTYFYSATFLLCDQRADSLNRSISPRIGNTNNATNMDDPVCTLPHSDASFLCQILLTSG